MKQLCTHGKSPGEKKKKGSWAAFIFCKKKQCVVEWESVSLERVQKTPSVLPIFGGGSRKGKMGDKKGILPGVKLSERISNSNNYI